MVNQTNNTTLSDLNTSMATDCTNVSQSIGSGANSENPSILNSISLNASRDRMNELFKDFKRINLTDTIVSGGTGDFLEGPENNKLQRQSSTFPSQAQFVSESSRFKDSSSNKYEDDFAHFKTPNGNNNLKNVKEEGQKITALYVGDLDINVDEQVLYNHFKSFKSLCSVKICHAPGSRTSLGYGYINFTSTDEAMKAIEDLNYTPILSKEIRIMQSLKGRDKLNSLGTNVFISSLNVSEIPSLRAFYERFRSYGKILSCKLDLRKRQGFISFEQNNDAEKFVNELNETKVDGLKIYCSIHIPKSLRDGSQNFGTNRTINFSNTSSTDDYDQTMIPSQLPQSRKNTFVTTMETMIYGQEPENLDLRHVPAKFSSSKLIKSPIESPASPSFPQVDLSGFKQVYVKGLPVNVTEDQLKDIFSKFGEIVEIYKENVPKFKSSWGLVTFGSEEAAVDAIKEIHKSTYEGKKITCVKALKKTDRQLQLLKDKPNLVVPQRESSMRRSTRKVQNVVVTTANKEGSFKLYMYNLPQGINENFFKVFLRSYTLEGEIKKYCVNYPKSEDNYIEFENESDAKEVLAKLNGVQISGHILQASMYRLRPQAVTLKALGMPSMRRVSFQEEAKPDKYMKKVHNYSNARVSPSRSNSSIFHPNEILSVIPYAKPGQIIPSSIARNAPLYQNINGNRYKLVPISNNITISESLGFVVPQNQKPSGSAQVFLQQPRLDLSRSPSLVKPDANSSSDSVVLRLEHLASENINFLQFPSATRPRNLRRIIQYMFDTIWLNNYDLIRETLDQAESDPKAMDDFKVKLNETLTLFGFER